MVHSTPLAAEEPAAPAGLVKPPSKPAWAAVTDAQAGPSEWRHGALRCHREELLVSQHLCVATVECGPGDDLALRAQDSDEDAIVFVRTGRFGRRVQGGFSVLDSTQGYLRHKGDEELVQHLGPHGHRCTVLTLRPERVPALLRLRSRVGPLEFRTSPPTDLAHRLLVAECRRRGDLATIAAMATALVHTLVAEWERPSRDPVRRGTLRASRRIVDIARETVSGVGAAPSLRSVAAAANVSPQQLQRVFKSSTGLTLSRYRNRVRVRLALERLGEGEDDLSRLAHELGFFDHSHFSRTISSEIGIPPRTLRELLSTGPRAVA